MYNIYKYQEDVKTQENMRHQDQSYTKWLVRHQQMKTNATQKIKQRTQQFIAGQLANPISVEDDHYQTWRYNKQFRDIQDSNKFIGFKTFRHRPNYDLGKYFTERQRKQMKQVAQKSHELVKSRRIPDQLRSRSLRSQGPLNPKHTFRDRKSDQQYIQPRMRYTNITDKQRHLQNSITYDDKLSKVFENFSMTKSKIGKINKSTGKDINSPYFDMAESTYSDAGKNQQFHYDVSNYNEEENQAQKKRKKSKIDKSRLFREKQSPRRSYFKSAKTMALNGDTLANTVMLQSQYDRQKDLGNLKNNWDNQNYIKRPIL